MELTIRRKTYTITASDKFMDNGRQITLMSQGESPRLTEPAVKELSSFDRINVRKGYTRDTSTFNLDIPGGDPNERK